MLMSKRNYVIIFSWDGLVTGRVFSTRAPVLGLCFLVSVNTQGYTAKMPCSYE